MTLIADNRTAKLQRLQLFCRFYAGLNDFLPANRRQVEFSHWINAGQWEVLGGLRG